MESESQMCRDSVTGVVGMAALAMMGFEMVCAQQVISRRYDATPSMKDGEVQVRAIRPPAAKAMVGVLPLGLSLTPKVELPNEAWDVILLRVNLLAGSHRCVYGLDIGTFGNFADNEMMGLGIAGLFNDTVTSGGALHVAGIVNHSAWHFSGLQLTGGLSWTEGSHFGLQTALGNMAGRLSGVQIGVVNVTDGGTGLQIGLYNHAAWMEGFQIGVVNVNRASSVPCMPVLNFAF